MYGLIINSTIAAQRVFSAKRPHVRLSTRQFSLNVGDVEPDDECVEVDRANYSGIICLIRIEKYGLPARRG